MKAGAWILLFSIHALGLAIGMQVERRWPAQRSASAVDVHLVPATTGRTAVFYCVEKQ